MENTERKDASRGRPFSKGNRVAVGNCGGPGRPRKALSDLLNETSEWSIRRLRKIASDEKHEHQFDALRELARISTPKRREHTGDAGAELGAGSTFVDHLTRIMREDEAQTRDGGNG